jgi:hypothetical protein
MLPIMHHQKQVRPVFDGAQMARVGEIIANPKRHPTGAHAALAAARSASIARCIARTT